MQRPALSLRFAALSAALLAGCAALAPPEERAAPPDLTLQGVTIEEYRGGALQARSSAQELRFQRDQARAQADGLQIAPLAGGRPQGRLEAAAAEAWLKSGALELSGGVRYRSSSGDTTRTEKCTADLFARTARGEERVELAGSGYRLEAPAFDASFGDAPKMQLRGGVTARVEPPAPAPAPAVRPKRGTR